MSQVINLLRQSDVRWSGEYDRKSFHAGLFVWTNCPWRNRYQLYVNRRRRLDHYVKVRIQVFRKFCRSLKLTHSIILLTVQVQTQNLIVRWSNELFVPKTNVTELLEPC